MLDLILPFLLFFTIIFAALQKTMILARRKPDKTIENADEVKKYNLVIALVIALLAVIPHIVFNDGDLTNGRLGGPLMGLPNVVEIINNALPSVAVWVIAILMVLLLCLDLTMLLVEIGRNGLPALRSLLLLTSLFLQQVICKLCLRV
jgi:Mn2+/Fe2+ NRAMP family transporter